MSNLNDKIKLKKFISHLKEFSGRHTEFVSVYLPPNSDVNKTVQNLRLEQQTATNIKDKNNSKAVISALEKMIQTLLAIEKIPKNGIAIFSGNISYRENIQNYQSFWIEPFEEINIKLYRCDKKFILEPLEDLSSNEEVYGLVAMDKGEACVGLLTGSSIKVIKLLTSNVPGKHKSGGQSAQRFARIREGAAVEFYKRISEILISEFTYKKELKGILIGGPGTTKNNFFEGSYINDFIKGKVLLPLLDITYTNDFGLKELVDRAKDIIEKSEVQEERNSSNEFLETLAKQTNMVCYGFENSKNCLMMGAVKTLLLIDDKIDQNSLEELVNLCDENSTELKLITNKTPEGKQIEGLSGIVGILRYPVET